jgi:hypothetical protein
MTPTDPFDPARLVSPVCRPTVERLQAVLDGELPADALDADPHPTVCAACRERIAAARMLISVLATAAPTPVPTGMNERILRAVTEDRYSRIRRRAYVYSGGAALAIAATILLVGWLTNSPNPLPVPVLPYSPDIAKGLPTAPEPRPAKPIRLGDEFSKAGNALRDVPKSITDSTSAAPELFAAVSDAFTRPMSAVVDMDPPSSTLSDIPDAARTGLEPVTDTAQKAFTRLIHDVGGMQLGARPPKS